MLRVMGCVLKQGDFTAPAEEMHGKCVVITGPSIGGIGFETALGLAGFGAKLFLAARNTTKGDASAAAIKEKYPEAQVEVMKCDISDLESVRDLAASLTAPSMPPVDVIVANAGCRMLEHATNKEGVEMTFATCVLGHHLLTHLVKPSRIVTVTGDIYCMAKGPADPLFKYDKHGADEAYHRASLGRMLIGSETRRRAQAQGKPEVVVVHPGVVATNFMGAGRVLKGLMGAMLISPKAGAQSSIFAASCPSSNIPEDKFYFHNKRRWVKLADDDKASDAQAAKALFDQCDSLCGLG